MTVTMTEPSAVQRKFAATRAELSAALIERDAEIDMVLTALLAQEHPLLVGPPGSAKSLLLDSLMGWMHGRKFSVLLTRFTTPEEVFGPLSLTALREDRYRRVTAGRLPEADGAFADEVFKASSAILNTLLRVLNERVYDNGEGTPITVPLRILVAASNEWPQEQEGGKELAAVLDRFLLRKEVRPIATAAGRKRLLWAADLTPRLSTSITPAELDQAHAEALALPWSAEAQEALEEVVRELGREGVRPGDRRQRKSVKACQAFAYLDGVTQVEPEHLEALAHCLWDDPAEQPQKVAAVVAKIANPAGLRLNALLLEAEQVVAAANLRDLAQAATCAAKLSEIDRQLGLVKADARQARARAHVQALLKQVRLGSLGAA
jgi:MoxR-like ATPase